MSRHIFIFKRKWTTTNPFCKKEASHGSAYRSSEQHLRGGRGKLFNEQSVAPMYLFSPEETQH